MDDGPGGAENTNGKTDEKATSRKKDEVSVGTAD
jgi:hypothetical protein